MDYDEKIIDDIVQRTMLEMEQRAPIQIHRLKQNEAQFQEVVRVARKSATEEVKMAKDFAGQPSNVLEIFKKNLPSERVKMITEGLSHPTYRLEISKMADGDYKVNFSRDGKTFLPDLDLTTQQDIELAQILQLASIVVEGVMLVSSAVGIELSPSPETIATTAEEVAPTLKASIAFLQAEARFVRDWIAGGDNAWKKAKSLFSLLKATYDAGLLWKVIKSLSFNMSSWDWLKIAVRVNAKIIAAILTEGVVLIANIALVVLDAVIFAQKLNNLALLDEAKSSLGCRKNGNEL